MAVVYNVETIVLRLIWIRRFSQSYNLANFRVNTRRMLNRKYDNARIFSKNDANWKIFFTVFVLHEFARGESTPYNKTLFLILHVSWKLD